MKAGVSTACMFPMQMEQALELYGKIGIGRVELFFNTPRELEMSSLCRLKALTEQYGVQVVSIHPFTSEMEPFFFFSDYTGRLEDGIDLYRRFYEAAAFLGAKLLVFHGDHTQNPYPWEKGFTNIEALGQVGREFGVELMQENVARCKSGSTAYLQAMHRALPQQRFVLDCKQALRSGTTAWELVETLGENIGHIHISDSAEHQDCLPIGAGNVDWERFFALLHQKKFTGHLMVELYRHNFKQVLHLKRSVEQIMDWINFTI